MKALTRRTVVSTAPKGMLAVSVPFVLDFARGEIVERMCEIPARTIEGLAFKARVSQDHEENRFEELVTSIMDDILALAGGVQA